jgi:hypothetical protein
VYFFEAQKLKPLEKISPAVEKFEKSTKGVRKCKHKFKPQFSSSAHKKTCWDYEVTSKHVVCKVI